MLVTLYPAGGLRSIRLPRNVLPECEYYKILEMRILDSVLLISPRSRRPRAMWSILFRNAAKREERRLLIRSDVAILARKMDW